LFFFVSVVYLNITFFTLVCPRAQLIKYLVPPFSPT
jgi:hypothetical protein